MRIVQLAGLTVLASLAATAPAQLRPTPYIVNFDDNVNLVGYDYGYDFADPGSTSAKFIEDKHGVKVTASQNTQSLRVIVDALNGHTPFPKKTTIHRGDSLGGLIEFMWTGLHSVSFPALQSASTEIGTIRMVLNADPAGPQFLGNQPLSLAEVEAVKRDRKKTPWLVNAFHFKLDGVVDHMVTGVSGFEIANVGDLDGDGMPDFRTTGPIEITIPEELLPKYLGWIGPDPTTPRIFKICWLGNTGEPFLTFRGEMTPAGWGHTDPFNPPSAGGTVNVRITRGDVALISDTTCSMGGA